MAEVFTCKATVLLRFRRLPEMNLGRLRTFTPEGGPSEKPQNHSDDVTMAAFDSPAKTKSILKMTS